MAVEKILQTRILNKVDTLENWNASSLPIKKGEICIATVAASAGTGLTEPVVMIKIGEDGVKTFKDLPWNFYAKASDVLTACKSEAGLTEFVNDVIKASGLATSDALTALAGRVTTAEGEIDALQGLVGDKKVSVQINEAIAALDLANTYAAKSHTHAMSDVTGLSDAIADAKKAGTDANTALEAYKVTNDAAVKANTDDIAAIKNADTGILAQAKAYADTKNANITAAKNAADAAQADVDALEEKVGTVTEGKTVVEMIAEAQSAAEAKVTAEETRAKAAEKANSDAISALQTKVGDSSVASQISTAVTNAKTELKGSDTDTDASATIAGAKKYADKLDAAMDTRVDALEAAVGTGGSVDTKISDAIGKLDKEDAAVAGQYVSAVSEADGVITVTRAALPDYTDTYAAKEHTHAIADVTGLQDALDGKVDDSEFTTLDGKVTTLIGDDASKSARSIAAEEVAKIVAGADESFDTLKEIADWISTHKTDAAAMNSAITALEGLVGSTPVSEQINSAITALKNGDIKSAVERIAALEADTHTHANKALLDTYTQTEADLADAVAKKHEHANATELAKFVDGDKAKLDAAVQTITAGTGLTATKTGTDVTIGFDDSVTFIFDCGSSAV